MQPLYMDNISCNQKNNTFLFVVANIVCGCSIKFVKTDFRAS